MAKLLLFNCKDEVSIRQILTPMKIRAVTVPADKFGLTLGELASEKWSDVAAAGPVPRESALVLCDFTKKQMDTFLMELRRKNVMVDYKSVLTPTNRKWDVKHLYFELAKEKAAILRSMKK